MVGQVSLQDEWEALHARDCHAVCAMYFGCVCVADDDCTREFSCGVGPFDEDVTSIAAEDRE